jgi:xanthosine utilization system XapX-like protein
MNPDPTVTIPHADPIPLPAPAAMLWFLLMLTFILHVLPMNLVLGGSILGSITEAIGRRGDRPHHRALARWLWKVMPVAIAFTSTMGVAPLLFLQVLYGRLFFTSSILMAWPWLAIVPLLILAYAGAYLRAFRSDRLGGAGAPLSWVVTFLFIAIGFLFSNNMTLMLRPAAFHSKYLADGRGLHLNLGDATLYPRYLHFLIGAIAVTGMMVVLLGLVRRRSRPEFGDWAIRYGSFWFAHSTSLNILVGIWWLIALPRETMLRFMGGNIVATVVFVFGAGLGIAVMMIMLQASKSPKPAPLAVTGLIGLIVVLVAMTYNRDQVRQAALESAGFEPVAWVAPQWGPILLFVILLVAALATVGWMLMELWRPRAPRPG